MRPFYISVTSGTVTKRLVRNLSLNFSWCFNIYLCWQYVIGSLVKVFSLFQAVQQCNILRTINTAQAIPHAFSLGSKNASDWGTTHYTFYAHLFYHEPRSLVRGTLWLCFPMCLSWDSCILCFSQSWWCILFWWISVAFHWPVRCVRDALQAVFICVGHSTFPSGHIMHSLGLS